MAITEKRWTPSSGSVENTSAFLQGILAVAFAHADRLRAVLLLGIAVTGVVLLYVWVK